MPLQFVQGLLDLAVIGNAHEYAADASANFGSLTRTCHNLTRTHRSVTRLFVSVIQAVLRRFCSELERKKSFLDDFLATGGSIRALGKYEKETLKHLGRQSSGLLKELLGPGFTLLVSLI